MRVLQQGWCVLMANICVIILDNTFHIRHTIIADLLKLVCILKSEFGGKNNGLHRDDSLTCFENKSGLSWKKSKIR